MSYTVNTLVDNKTPIHCILGILNTDRGIQIAKQMLVWITLLYDTTIIHDGCEYESNGLYGINSNI